MSQTTQGDKAKLQAARVLIEEKRYQEARALLRGVNHPTAVDWILKIDKLTGDAQRAATPVKTKSGTRYLLGGLSLFAFVVFVIALLAALSARNYSEQLTGGIIALVSVLAAYFFNRLARRYKTS